MGIQRICFFVSENLYESKRYFVAKFSEALERAGVAVKIVDVQVEPPTPKTLDELYQFSPDCTAAFNSLLPLEDGSYMWDRTGIPHWQILVDPPAYSMDLFRSKNVILSCVDKFDVEAIEASHFERVFFFPHAVERGAITPTEGDRKYEVVFLGTCIDYENLEQYWRKKLPKDQIEVLDEAIDYLWHLNAIPMIEGLMKAWNYYDLDRKKANFVDLFYYLDNMIRGKDRVDLIRSIKDAHVHVFGAASNDHPSFSKGWEEYVGGQSNVTIHPAVNFEDGLDIMRQSKICLNSSPFFRNGTHERVFYALACGALPFSSLSLYLREEFPQGVIPDYTSMHFEDVNARINAILGDQKNWRENVLRGQEIVDEKHTWDQAAKLAIEELSSHLQQL